MSAGSMKDTVDQLLWVGIILCGLFGLIFVFGSGANFGSGQFGMGMTLIVIAGLLMMFRSFVIARM